MPASITWHPEFPQRVIYVHVHGDITFDDIHLASSRSAYLGNSVADVTIHNLIDGSDIKHLPLNLTQMFKANQIENRVKNLGWIVIVIPSGSALAKTVSFVILALSRLLNFQFRFFHSKFEAEQFLLEIDSTLHRNIE
jgi:hypothetical protein